MSKYKDEFIYDDQLKQLNNDVHWKTERLEQLSHKIMHDLGRQPRRKMLHTFMTYTLNSVAVVLLAFIAYQFVLSDFVAQDQNPNTPSGTHVGDEEQNGDEIVGAEEDKQERIDNEEVVNDRVESIATIIIGREDSELYEGIDILTLRYWDFGQFDENGFVQSTEDLKENETYVFNNNDATTLEHLYNHTINHTYPDVVTDYFKEIYEKYDNDTSTNKQAIKMIAELGIHLDMALKLEPYPTEGRPWWERGIEEEPLEIVASTKHFNLLDPTENEILNVEDFGIMGELHKDGVIQVEVVDMDGNILNDHLEIDRSWFDDPHEVAEWTTFGLKMSIIMDPKTSEGLFRIIDHTSNEKIEIPVSFSGVE